MRYEDISPAMRGFLGGWEAMRKLGFRSDDIYLLVNMSARTYSLNCFVVLKTQGKEFYLEVGPIGVDEDSFNKEYVDVTTAINKGAVPEDDLDRIWRESEVHRNRTGFVTALLLKGIEIQRLTE